MIKVPSLGSAHNKPPTFYGGQKEYTKGSESERAGKKERSRAIKNSKGYVRVTLYKFTVQGPVVRRLDNDIYRINCYPVDKC